MIKEFDIFVKGNPKPKGSGTRTRNGGWFESCKKLVGWQAAVRKACEIEMVNKEPFEDAPLEVWLVFFMKRPRGHYGVSGVLRSAEDKLPCVAPDIDKLCRGVFDGMEKGGVMDNDSRIVIKRVAQFYAESAKSTGVWIRAKKTTREDMEESMKGWKI